MSRRYCQEALLERIVTLEAERDRAREECGHEKAMRKHLHTEMSGWITRFMLAKKALVATGYFTADQIGYDLAPRITEMWSEIAPAMTPSPPTPDEETP